MVPHCPSTRLVFMHCTYYDDKPLPCTLCLTLNEMLWMGSWIIMPAWGVTNTKKTLAKKDSDHGEKLRQWRGTDKPQLCYPKLQHSSCQQGPNTDQLMEPNLSQNQSPCLKEYMARDTQEQPPSQQPLLSHRQQERAHTIDGTHNSPGGIHIHSLHALANSGPPLAYLP